MHATSRREGSFSMQIRGRTAVHRGYRGAVMVEAAIVLPTLFIILIGMITIGMGIFRYQQVAALAREGARYAAVHGAQYEKDAQDAGDNTKHAADYTDIYNNA